MCLDAVSQPFNSTQINIVILVIQYQAITKNFKIYAKHISFGAKKSTPGRPNQDYITEFPLNQTLISPKSENECQFNK